MGVTSTVYNAGDCSASRRAVMLRRKKSFAHGSFGLAGTLANNIKKSRVESQDPRLI